MITVQQLVAQLKILVADADHQINGVPEGNATGPSFAAPRLTVVDGVNMILHAPLNPLYKPSEAARLFGQKGYRVSDPSNGDGSATQPLRSPAGFPLFYAKSLDGSAVGAPSVSYGDQNYPDDAAVMAEISRTTLTPEQTAAAAALNDAEWAKVNARIGQQNPPRTMAEISRTTLTPEQTAALNDAEWAKVNARIPPRTEPINVPIPEDRQP